MNDRLQNHNENLLGSIYDAVLAPHGFQHFIEALCEEFPSRSVTLITRHAATHEIKALWVSGVENQWLERYALEYAPEDPLARHMTTSPIAKFYATNLDIADQDGMFASRFYREWAEPQGVTCGAGAIVLREGAWLTQLNLKRGNEHQLFGRGELDRLDALSPHLQRAMQMRQRFAELQLGRNFLTSGLNVLAVPTLLFDEYGRVVHANRSAGAALKEHSSLWLEDDHVCTNDPAATRNFNLELGKAIRASRGRDTELPGVVLLPRAGHMPLMLMLVPLHLDDSASTQGAALTFVFDPEATAIVTPDLVRRLFQLTEAEAELAVALCSGKTLDAAAVERGTSIHTTRSQLKSIFNKTGTKRQADLVSLLLASPAHFLAQHGDVETMSAVAVNS